MTREPSTHGQRLVGAISSLTRTTRFRLVATTPLDLDVGHPQGLTRWGENWLVSTVYPRERRGAIHEVSSLGTVVRTLDVTDGDRIHPGGIDVCTVDDSPRCWIPVAEYRPHSTTTLLHLDHHLHVEHRVHIDDHIGAICELHDGTLLGVSWGSRTLYRFSTSGQILERRDNPSHVVDHQDLQVLGADAVPATGVGEIHIDHGQRQIGALSIIDPTSLHLVHEVPVMHSMPSGRVMTYNGLCVDHGPNGLRVHCLVDDGTAAIGHWDVID